jgi:hypothetical protein
MRSAGALKLQKQGPESWEAITRPASLTDADTLTDRQLKSSDPGMRSCMHASSFSHSSVSDLDPPGPIRLVTALMKLFNSRSGSETGSPPTAAAVSTNPRFGISRNSDIVVLDSEDRGSRTGTSIQMLNRHGTHSLNAAERASCLRIADLLEYELQRTPRNFEEETIAQA